MSNMKNNTLQETIAMEKKLTSTLPHQLLKRKCTKIQGAQPHIPGLMKTHRLVV